MHELFAYGRVQQQSARSMLCCEAVGPTLSAQTLKDDGVPRAPAQTKQDDQARMAWAHMRPGSCSTCLAIEVAVEALDPLDPHCGACLELPLRMAMCSSNAMSVGTTGRDVYLSETELRRS